MATVTPTKTQFAPNSGVKMVMYQVTCSASDTFTVSSEFSTVIGGWGLRTLATGTIVTVTASGTTVTVGSGPSSEAAIFFIVGTA